MQASSPSCHVNISSHTRLKSTLLVVNRQVQNRASHSRMRRPASPSSPPQNVPTHCDDRQCGYHLQQGQFHYVSLRSVARLPEYRVGNLGTIHERVDPLSRGLYHQAPTKEQAIGQAETEPEERHRAGVEPSNRLSSWRDRACGIANHEGLTHEH